MVETTRRNVLAVLAAGLGLYVWNDENSDNLVGGGGVVSYDGYGDQAYGAGAYA